MMWFTADLHLGDTNILHDMDRPFDSVEEMNRKVIDAINECVAADDRLYILGDFTYRLPMAEAARLRDQVVKLKSTVEDKSEEDVLKDLKRGARKGSAYGNRKHAAYGSSRAN